MKIHNKGLSYIELILVISIATILTGLASITMAVVNRNNITKAGDSLESGFKSAQIASLAKGSDRGALYVYGKGGRCYYSIGSIGSEESKISSSALKVTINISGTNRNVTDGFVARFRFDPATGGSKGVDWSSNGGSSWTNATSFNVGDIVVSNKSGKKVTLNLRKMTGKIEIN